MDFTPGLNIITGPTDSGKTAIIRAIRWVVLGEPAGDPFVNKAVGFTRVSITADKGLVMKTRKGTKTSYQVDQTLYEKSEIPVEVSDIVGLQKVSFGDFEPALQIAYQLDSPFLLSESPSVGAKVLGKLANAELVDAAIKKAAKGGYDARAEKAAAEKELRQIETSLQLYVGLPDIRAALDTCHALYVAIEAKQNLVERLSALKKSYDELRNTVNAATKRIAQFGDLETVRRQLAVTDGHVDLMQKNTALWTRFSDITNKVSGIRGVLRSTAMVDSYTDALAVVEQSFTKLRNLIRVSETYSALLTRKNAITARLNDLQGFNGWAQTLQTVGVKQVRFSAIAGLQSLLARRIKLCAESTTAVSEAESVWEKLGQELQEAWKEERVCPLCERGFEAI